MPGDRIQVSGASSLAPTRRSAAIFFPAPIDAEVLGIDVAASPTEADYQFLRDTLHSIVPAL